MPRCTKLLSLVVAVVLLAAWPATAEDKAAPPATGTDKQGEKAPAQARRSNIIPSAGEADLPNDIGDVVPSGELSDL